MVDDNIEYLPEERRLLIKYLPQRTKVNATLSIASFHLATFPIDPKVTLHYYECLDCGLQGDLEELIEHQRNHKWRWLRLKRAMKWLRGLQV